MSKRIQVIDDHTVLLEERGMSMEEMKLAAMKKHLEKLAERGMWTDSDDFNPCDNSGGNYDDAYYGGSSDGETGLARFLLRKFFS